MSGFQVDIGGYLHHLTSFSVQEAATPLAGGDSSGQVGTISMTLKKPDPELIARDTKWANYGAQMLTNRSIRLTDSRKGFTLGRVKSVSENRGSGVVQVTCDSRLGDLNIYDVQAAPYRGTLSGAFSYYCSLAGINTDLLIDPSIATRPVVFPGFNGELWFYMKQMAAAMDADISLVSGVVLLRPIRLREAASQRDTDRSFNMGGSLAQSIEIFQYNNTAINNKMVYPPGGWSPEVAPITVNSGEYIEVPLELSASVSSIQQPVMQTFVAQNYDASSVFTVVGDDGLPVQPMAWRDYGGNLSVEINPDTTSLTVKIQAPSGLPTKEGKEIGVYGIALSADESTGRYSTLRIIGTGVAFDKQPLRIPTGVAASETGTEVGTTVDNPFVSTLADAYRMGVRAAKQFTGQVITISGSVTAINRLGDSGAATYPPYSYVQTLHQGKTYGQVQTEYASKTYQQIQDELYALVRNDFENQAFGNVNGARIWDHPSHRWYRIREGTLNPDLIQFSADDDLTYGDAQTFYAGNTYAQLQTFFNGFTYGEHFAAGLVYA